MSVQTIHQPMSKQNSMEIINERWAKRCKEAHQSQSALFGIVQGGMYEDLRENSLNALMEIDLMGIALGSLSLSESKEEKTKILAFMADKLPENKPRSYGGWETGRYCRGCRA